MDETRKQGKRFAEVVKAVQAGMAAGGVSVSLSDCIPVALYLVDRIPKPQAGPPASEQGATSPAAAPGG
jgi:hypothetical protein